ncbi:MAG: glycosyl transferase family 2, partial [uncultured bacterium]
IIKVINQINSGAPAARNRGVEEAMGEFVVFLDADTICFPNMISEMRIALEKNPKASFAYSQFCFGWKKIQSHSFDIGLLKKINYIDTTSLIRRIDVVRFDESLKRFQDWDLYLTMVEQGKTGVFVKKVLFKKQVLSSRRGINISNWLPSFIYKIPWKIKRVKDYEIAREIILKKHGLI